MGYFVALIFIILALVGLAVLLRGYKRGYQSRDFSPDDQQAWQMKWRQLETMLDDNPIHWPSAIIEADKLFDSVLKSKKFPGQDTGERYRYLLRDRPKMNYVWPARTLRNRVVHEADFILQKKSAQRALALYERALKDLGVMV
jgi:hypothetical protein